MLEERCFEDFILKLASRSNFSHYFTLTLMHYLPKKKKKKKPKSDHLLKCVEHFLVMDENTLHVRLRKSSSVHALKAWSVKKLLWRNTWEGISSRNSCLTGDIIDSTNNIMGLQSWHFLTPLQMTSLSVPELVNLLYSELSRLLIYTFLFI